MRFTRQVSQDSPVLQAAAARSLRYLYVLWEASPEGAPGNGERDLQATTVTERTCRFDHTRAPTAGCYITVLDISAFSRTRLEVRTISTTLESAADLVQSECPAEDPRSPPPFSPTVEALSLLHAECQALVHQAEGKWSEAVEVIKGMRSRLQSLMNDYMMEKQADPDADIDQLERLLILGQSACPENALHQFLSATLGEPTPT